MLVDNPILKEDMEYVASQISSLGFKNSTFFITGATGLVGSLLSMSILYANDKYALCNKVIVHVRDKSKAESIFHSSSSLDYSVGDIRSEIDYDGSVDYIIHAASETKSKNMVSSPVETLLTTIEGTKNTLDFALRNKVKAFVYISSMEAFGDVDKQGKAKEEDLGYIDLTKARSSYSEGKRAAENMCCCYSHEYDVPVTVARLAQTFGAGVGKDDTRVFAQFARSVLENKDIVLHSLGKSCGNYVYTADALASLFLLLKKGERAEIYTVCNEESSMSIKEMADMVASSVAGNKIKVVFDIPEDSDKYGYAPDVRLRLDSSKLRSLGWKPCYSLKDSYIRLLEYWKN